MLPAYLTWLCDTIVIKTISHKDGFDPKCLVSIVLNFSQMIRLRFRGAIANMRCGIELRLYGVEVHDLSMVPFVLVFVYLF
jgi:hypothetical protein